MPLKNLGPFMILFSQKFEICMILCGSSLTQFVNVFVSGRILYMCLSAENFYCNSYFVFDPKDSRLEIFVVDDEDIVSTLNTESSSAASQIQWWWTALIFFCDFL